MVSGTSPGIYATYRGSNVESINFWMTALQAGVISEVLITAVLPAAIAAMSGEKVRLMGKLYGGNDEVDASWRIVNRALSWLDEQPGSNFLGLHPLVEAFERFG